MQHQYDILDDMIFNSFKSVVIKDITNEDLHKYHEVCLQLLTNIYNTKPGCTYAMETSWSKEIIDFCKESFCSKDSNTVKPSENVLCNHVNYNKTELSNINKYLLRKIRIILDAIKDIEDTCTLEALIVCEMRMMYNNVELLKET